MQGFIRNLARGRGQMSACTLAPLSVFPACNHLVPYPLARCDAHVKVLLTPHVCASTCLSFFCVYSPPLAPTASPVASCRPLQPSAPIGSWWCTRTRRCINDQIIQLPPSHLAQKLPNHPILLWSSPYYRVPSVLQQEPYTHDAEPAPLVYIYGHPAC